jgi:hypothetical protein
VAGETRGAVPAREALAFALLFVLAYGALAVLLFTRTPRLFEHLDQIFDADLGLWTIDLARPQGPHLRTRVHPLAVLLLNPLGWTLRELLRGAGVRFAARAAAGLLAALAGGTTVGLFRALLHRLGISPGLARAWVLVFALSATQIVFSSVPESFAFSALGLVLVFAVAAGPRPTEARRTLAGLFAFGITVTNVVAVALARASAWNWRREAARAASGTARHVLAVLVLAAALGVVQWALYPTFGFFFVPGPLAAAYERSFVSVSSASEVLDRAEELGSHLVFVGLAAPSVSVEPRSGSRVAMNFPRLPLRHPRAASAAHAVLWAVLLVLAGRGLARSRHRPPVVFALLLWLGSVAALHAFFGLSLFLYSAHWVFALVATAAVGLERVVSEHERRRRLLAGTLLALAALQAAANGALVVEIVRVYSRRA